MKEPEKPAFYLYLDRTLFPHARTREDVGLILSKETEIIIEGRHGKLLITQDLEGNFIVKQKCF